MLSMLPFLPLLMLGAYFVVAARPRMLRRLVPKLPEAPVWQLLPEAEDRYAVAVAYLTQHPSEIHAAWSHPSCHVAGALFRMASRRESWSPPSNIGCLTMIRSDRKYRAQTLELTDAIRLDTRIPCSSRDVTVNDLPVFAEWQRRLDREL
jgi:hypothetical protein